MKAIRLVAFFVAIILVAACQKPSVNADKILKEATMWPGRVGGPAKSWVGLVVEMSLDQTLPFTDSENPIRWVGGPIVYSDFQSLRRGDILQMFIRRGGEFFQHTAIVQSDCNASKGCRWLDSDWSNDNIVRSHFVSVSEMKAMTTGDSRLGFMVYRFDR